MTLSSCDTLQLEFWPWSILIPIGYILQYCHSCGAQIPCIHWYTDVGVHFNEAMWSECCIHGNQRNKKRKNRTNKSSQTDMNLSPLALSCSNIPSVHDKIYGYLATIPWQRKLIIKKTLLQLKDKQEQAWALLPKKGGADESKGKLLPGNFFPRGFLLCGSRISLSKIIIT